MRKLLASRKKETKVGEGSKTTRLGESITSGKGTEHEDPIVRSVSPQAPPDAHRSLGVKVLYEPPKPSDALVE